MNSTELQVEVNRLTEQRAPLVARSTSLAAQLSAARDERARSAADTAGVPQEQHDAVRRITDETAANEDAIAGIDAKLDALQHQLAATRSSEQVATATAAVESAITVANEAIATRRARVRAFLVEEFLPLDAAVTRTQDAGRAAVTAMQSAAAIAGVAAMYGNWNGDLYATVVEGQLMQQLGRLALGLR